MGNGTTYNAYKKRRQGLMGELSRSPYNQLQQEVSQVGRETQRIAKQTDATLKRQSVPLGARIESQRQLQTSYAQNVGSAYDRVSTQDAQRKQGLMLELDKVDAQVKAMEEQQNKGVIDTAIQVGSTLLGAGASLIPGVGFTALLGAQYGAAGGQVISGGYNIAQGDATAQDWANIGQGIISGVSLGAEQATLKSIKAENTRTMQFMTEVFNDKNMPDWQSKLIIEQAETRLINGDPIDDIMEMYKGINQMTPKEKALDKFRYF